jgi:hypothetical protein
MLTKRSLFRVVYRRSCPSKSGDGEGFWIGNRKTVVADDIQEAIDAVRAHETAEIVISEVVREAIEVWA